MEKESIVAIAYDFDKTLSPKNMQEYGFVPGVGLDSETFWTKCNELARVHNMDPILAYMFMMKEESEGKMLLTREVFNDLGKNVDFFPGVIDYFDRVNNYCASLGLKAEHYILSSGLKEIIEGTLIAKNFKKIYAAEFCYNAKNVPVWPAMAVNYTSKTQFLYRINKGVLSVNEHDALNESTPEKDRRVPFSNIIYIGDGLTDVPCMKLCKANGGHSIAVFENDDTIANSLIKQGRVDYLAKSDYTQNSDLDLTLKIIINKIKAKNDALRLHDKHLDSVKKD